MPTTVQDLPLRVRVLPTMPVASANSVCQNEYAKTTGQPFWQTELAAATGIVGSTLTLSGKSCTVVGIMPRSFELYPKQTSLWTQITPESQFSESKGAFENWLSGVI